MKIVEIKGGVVTSAPGDILVVDWDNIEESDEDAIRTLYAIAEVAIGLPQGPGRIAEAIERLIAFVMGSPDA